MGKPRQKRVITTKAYMGNYKRKLDTLDPERGDCLMLYVDNLEVVMAMNEHDSIAILRGLINWFLGATEESVLKEVVETAHDKRLAKTMLGNMIGRQKGFVENYLEDCRRKQNNALRAKSKYRAKWPCEGQQ